MPFGLTTLWFTYPLPDSHNYVEGILGVSTTIFYETQCVLLQGIHTPSAHHKLSLYADDLLNHARQPHITLPSLFFQFQRFGKLSNFKLNISKTEALNISLPASTMSTLQSNYSFHWQTKGITYLGVIILVNLSNLFTLNYIPLLSRLRKDLASWEDKTIPWFGRINTLKMDTLPKLLYLYQTIPVIIPKSFFSTLRSLSIRFLWNKGLSRIKFKLLTRPKLQGGTGLPDF